jgi:signal transduction histidine kinase
MSNWIAIFSALGYLGLLFGVAWYAEHRQKKGNSLINNGYIYALSMAVYCTAWTYYGSVGRAANNGIEFLAIYLGPTIAAALFIPVLHKILRIAKTQRINSIADLISSRYGKNFSIAVVVTILCVLGIIPYISLQIKAITSSMHALNGSGAGELPLSNFVNDDSFYISLVLAVFIVLFGTRSIDASEKHEGLVAAIAFESVIKIIGFVAAGIFVVYGLFNGFTDIFTQMAHHPQHKELLLLGNKTSYASWTGLIIISMLAIFFLPRQFQVAVVENMNETHIKKAVWLFPLYLLLINIFVLPIAFGGQLIFSGTSTDADTYVLALPLHFDKPGLGLLVFIGGFSAATSMIIVETIALSTMMSNNIVTPIFLWLQKFKLAKNDNVTQSIIGIRRVSICVILILAYLYNKIIGQHLSLVSIGLVSFTAVAQFAPAVLGGIYWKQATKSGALAGICAGFVIWFYTLVLPSLVNAGFISQSLVEEGPFGISWLRPFSLLGVTGMDAITHAAFWSLFVNLLLFFIVSLYSKRNAQEIFQAEIFVDIFKHAGGSENTVWKGTAYLPDLRSLLQNFLGASRSEKLLNNYAVRHKIPTDIKRADPRLVTFSEKILAGIIGSASARIMVSSVTKEEEVKIEEVLHILRESQQMIELNKELRKKSTELQKTTQQLTIANEQLKDMDEKKDEFLYTVTHELRTPITSIRAMAEIVYDNPDMEENENEKFLSAIIKETERLSRLITQILNLERYESGRQKLNLNNVILNTLIDDTVLSVKALVDAKKIHLQKNIPNSIYLVRCDADLVQQVINNLLSNAIKFTDENGEIKISIFPNHDELQVWIQDNGKGISPALHELIFDKFFQAKNQTIKKPEGTGLGLAICKKIIEMHQGRIWVESEEKKGTTFIFTLPTN